MVNDSSSGESPFSSIVDSIRNMTREELFDDSRYKPKPVIHRVRGWRDDASAGHPTWMAALDRTIELVAPLWGDKELNWDGPLLADGGAALAMGIYILARERDTPVQSITRSDLDDSMIPERREQVRTATGETYEILKKHGDTPTAPDRRVPEYQTRYSAHEQVELWDRRLRALGHDPDDQDDPVMARWRELSREQYPGDPSSVPDELLTTTPTGPRLTDAWRFVLAPMWDLTF